LTRYSKEVPVVVLAVSNARSIRSEIDDDPAAGAASKAWSMRFEITVDRGEDAGSCADWRGTDRGV
jgi:hypothetical protein